MAIRVFRIGAVVVACALWVAADAARAQSPNCFNNLDRTTYDSGFSDSDFDTRTDMDISSGELKLATDDQELGDTNRISIRTRQELKIYYLYESAGGSHTLGWFLFDNNVTRFLAPNGFNFTSTQCSTVDDCDAGMQCTWMGGTKYCAYQKWKLRDDGTAGGWANNQRYDWFEMLYLKQGNNATPYLLRSGSNYSDGGTYAHIPNLLETLVSQGGGWIFLLCDDDTDTDTGGGSSPRLPPVADITTTNDGIPDYDVNGSGTVTLDDRMVEMGTFDAGTEITFFHIMFYDQEMRRHSAGMTWADYWDTIATKIVPFFSKRVLNPDYLPAGDEFVDRDIGCAYPNTCGGYVGWLDAATLTRLRNDFGLDMPHEVKRIHVRRDGQMEHMFLGAPSSDPTWWLLGFEDLYDGGDKDYNDIVFLVWRTNGGEAVSNDVAGEIPAGDKDETTITKVHIKKSDNIPIPPCSADPAEARIEYYISISEDQNGDPIWILVEFPASSPDEVTLDLQAMGHTGSKLRWKAVIISDNHRCQPTVSDIDVGYEGLRHGEYLFTSPLGLANTVFRAAMETPDDGWAVTGNDRSNRGRFKMYELYAPADPNSQLNRQLWDAGDALANRDPNTRAIYTSNTSNLGSMEPVSITGSAWLLSQVLSAADRALRHNGKPVYDLDGDGDSDDDDAKYIIQWTRGWETPTTQQRAWKLGAINTSTAAVVHMPGEPAWLEGTAIDPQLKSGYQSWAAQAAQSTRGTVAIVGAQDGMLHGFNAGAFRWGDNPLTASIVEQRGYFEFSSGNPNYGNGRELWAYIPPSLLNNLKNNRVRDYYPEDNPMAMVDGSVSVTDILHGADWKTVVFFTMGPLHPYLSALNVTNPASPEAQWTSDWTDPDFQGTTAAPTAGWVKVGAQNKWMVATTSGLSSTPGDVYLYRINASDGTTMADGKVKLNVGAGVRADQAYGVAGRPVLVDSDGDGLNDRIYVADTNGRVWKHEPEGAAGNTCLVAAVGQPIYVTPSISLRKEELSGKNVVAFYFGTGDRPDTNDAVSPPYKFFGFMDEDTAGQCTLADKLYEYDFPPDEKVWADAFIAADRVYVGTATGDKAHICDEDPNNPGHIYVFDLDPDSNGAARLLAGVVSAGGSVVSGIMVFDQHVFANTVGGKTKIIGGSSWNNLSGTSDAVGLRDLYWQEVINAQ